MIKVLPIQTKEDQKAICSACGVEFNADMLAYSVSVDDRLSGVCQFKLTDKGGVITDIAPTLDHRDEDALFVMGRSALNFIDLCGVHYATFVGECNDLLLRKIGFNKNSDEVYDINLEGFFTDHCH